MPVPSFLPVKVTVVLPEKGIRLENVTLKPTDTLADLRPMVEARVADRGDPVVDWGSDVQYILKTYAVSSPPHLFNILPSSGPTGWMERNAL